MKKGYSFKVAGTFAGISSFVNDDDVDVTMMAIDYMGGRVNVQVSEDFAKQYEGRPVGADVRADGSVLVAGGKFRLLLEQVYFDGDKGFEPLTFEDAVVGLVFTGVGFITRKRHWIRKDDSVSCQIDLKLFGASLTDFPVAPEVYKTLPEGQVTITGQVVSEVKKDFKGNLKSSNWFNLLGARGEERRRVRTEN